MVEFVIRGGEHILYGCGGTSALARGATLAARWLHGPQSISNHPVGWRFPHPAGRYRPGGFALFLPRVVGVVQIWKDFLSGEGNSSPGCGGTSALARGSTLTARWLHGPQPISNHPVGLIFLHPARRYPPGGSAFSSPRCWSCRDMEGFVIRG